MSMLIEQSREVRFVSHPEGLPEATIFRMESVRLS
jgi:hypothetical protein